MAIMDQNANHVTIVFMKELKRIVMVYLSVLLALKGIKFVNAKQTMLETIAIIAKKEKYVQVSQFPFLFLPYPTLIE